MSIGGRSINNLCYKKKAKKCAGFTLIELIIAMIITVIISSAVLVLSNAVASAYENSQSNAYRNAGVRSTNVFFTNAVKSSNLVLKITSNRICFWTHDSNGDFAINPAELIYFDYDDSAKEINIIKFSGVNELSDTIDLSSFSGNNYMEFLKGKYNEQQARLIDHCTRLNFSSDKVSPYAQLINLAFDIDQDNRNYHFEFTVAKKVSPIAWINSDGNLKGINDDD